jgi:hypothetical protein
MGYVGAAIGAITGGIGAAMKSEGEQAQYGQQAQAYGQRAMAARTIAAAQTTAVEEQNRETQAKIAPAAAAMGVDVGSASVLASELRTARLGNYNARLAGYNNVVEAWQADYAQKQAKAMKRYTGSMEGLNIGLGVIGGAIGGAGGGLGGSLATSG